MRRDGDGGFAAFLAAILLLLGIVVLYINGAIFNSGNFTNHALDALDNEGVRTEISKEIANSLIPPGAQGSTATEAIDSASSRLFDAPAFRSIVRTGVGQLHESVFDRDSKDVGVNLVGVGDPVREALQPSDPQLAGQVSPDANADVLNGSPPSWLLTIAGAGDTVHLVGLIALGAALLMAIVAFIFSSWRVATAGIFGGSLAVGAILLIAVLLIGKTLLTGLADDPGIEDALSGIWSAFLGGLLVQLIVLAIAGAAIPIATRLLRMR